MSDQPKTAAPTDSAPNNAPAKKNNEAQYDAVVPIGMIEPDPRNRDKIDPAKIKELALSIKDVGLLQPIVLRFMPKGDKYRIMAGERRWLAHKELKLPTIAARIYRDQSDLEAAKKKVVENAIRENLTPMEEARKYRELTDLGMKQTEIGELLGKSQPVIANAMRLLELPADVQKFVSLNAMSMAHAVGLCRFKAWPKICLKIAELADEKGAPAKQLNEGLPFSEELEDAKLVKQLDYTSDRKDLPKAYQEDPDIMPGVPEYEYEKPYLNCLNFEKGKTIIAALEAERQRLRAQQSPGSGRTANGKMTEAAKDERRKVIIGNKRRRAETQATLDAGANRLKAVKDVDQRALAVIVQEALRANYSASRVSAAAKLLELSVPKGTIISSWTSIISLEKLRLIPAVDLIRVAALAIAATHGEQALRNASECPKEVEVLAGGKKVVVAVEKPKAAAKPVKSKASSRGVITAETRAYVKKLIEAGKTGAMIAKDLGISLPSVQNIKKAFGLVVPRK